MSETADIIATNSTDFNLYPRVGSHHFVPFFKNKAFPIKPASKDGVLRKLILRSFLPPGDVLMLTAALRDLHLMYPGSYITDVRTVCPALWEHNPLVLPLDETSPDVEVIDCGYPLIHESNDLPYHFVHGYRIFLCERLGVPIKPTAFRGDINISYEEKGWLSQVDVITGTTDTPFWIIVSGGKKDFTAKWWDPDRCQQVVASQPPGRPNNERN